MKLQSLEADIQIPLNSRVESQSQCESYYSKSQFKNLVSATVVSDLDWTDLGPSDSHPKSPISRTR